MVKINFTFDEVHDMHMALSEALEKAIRSGKHKETHKDNPCAICEDYGRLRKKILKYCDCIEGTGKYNYANRRKK